MEDEAQETYSEGGRLEVNDVILAICWGGGWHLVEVFQKLAGRRSQGEGSFTGTWCALGLRAPELCGFSCLFTLEVHRHGEVFWRVSLETTSQFSRNTASPDPGMTMDIFLPPVWVNWSMPGDLEERLYCCLCNLFSASIHSDGRGV